MLGYRIENGGKVFSHCVDTECTRVSREELGEDLPLYQNVDLMLFDAQYTLMESIERVNWGHAAASLGLDIAMREGVKRVLFMHHDPASTDEKSRLPKLRPGTTTRHSSRTTAGIPTALFMKCNGHLPGRNGRRGLSFSHSCPGSF